MSELVAFLEARLAEDEAVARDAETESGVYPDCWWGQPGARELDMNAEDAAHVARHDPARVLREVTAKRAILDVCGVLAEADGCGWAADQTLRALAAPFCDHPDFQEQWR